MRASLLLARLASTSLSATASSAPRSFQRPSALLLANITCSNKLRFYFTSEQLLGSETTEKGEDAAKEKEDSSSSSSSSSEETDQEGAVSGSTSSSSSEEAEASSTPSGTIDLTSSAAVPQSQKSEIPTNATNNINTKTQNAANQHDPNQKGRHDKYEPDVFKKRSAGKHWVTLQQVPFEACLNDVKFFLSQHHVHANEIRRQYDKSFNLVKLPMWFLSFDSEREARRIAVLLSNEKFGIHVTRAHYRGMATPSNSSNAFETQYGLIVRNVNKTSSMPGLMHSMGNMQNFYHFAVTVNPLRFHQRKYLNSRYRFMAAELDTTFVLCKFDNEEARSYCALTVPNNVFDARALQADVMD